MSEPHLFSPQGQRELLLRREISELKAEISRLHGLLAEPPDAGPLAPL
jgi:hypothetical protein